MRKQSRWNRYYKAQMADPETRSLVEEELKALRVGLQIAKLRQQKGLTQTQLAARVGISAPNVSRIETNPGQNLTLNTLVRLFGALDQELVIGLRSRQRVRTQRAARPREPR